MKNQNRIKTREITTDINPKYSLISIGFSDVDQITLKAVNTLSNADVIIYDELVNPELLKFAPFQSPKFLIKKKSTDKNFVNEQINKLLVDFAFVYGHVVHLQGVENEILQNPESRLEHLDSFNIPVDLVSLNTANWNFLLN